MLTRTAPSSGSANSSEGTKQIPSCYPDPCCAICRQFESGHPLMAGAERMVAAGLGLRLTRMHATLVPVLSSDVERPYHLDDQRFVMIDTTISD